LARRIGLRDRLVQWDGRQRCHGLAGRIHSRRPGDRRFGPDVLYYRLFSRLQLPIELQRSGCQLELLSVLAPLLRRHLLP